MIPLVSILHYRHPLGARAPYFEGLRQARAIASRCPTCGRAWFPPRHCCATGFHWEELAGTGTVVAVTDGFALVAMDGAENLALGILPAAAAVGCRVVLATAPLPVEHPAAAAVFQVLPAVPGTR